MGVLQEKRDFLWSGVRCTGVSIIRGDVWVVGVLRVGRDFLYNVVRCAEVTIAVWVVCGARRFLLSRLWK